MVIFHSYVSLPEGTFNFYKIINLLWRETLFFQKGISETVFFFEHVGRVGTQYRDYSLIHYY